MFNYSLLNLQGQMFLLILVGIILNKKKILPQNAKNILTDLLIYFVLPCNIIQSFRMDFSISMLSKFGLLLIGAVLIQVIAYILSRCLYRNDQEQLKKILQYATIVSNSGFLGLPVVEEIFGSEGLMYASVFIIPMRVMMWTAGIACFTGESNRKDAIRKVAVHPCIIAVYIGFAFMISGITLPEVLDKTIRGAGGCTTTISMIIIGMILAEVERGHFITKEVLKITAVRLVLLPLCALGISRLMGFSELMTGVSIILTAMPAGSTSAMLAAKYDCDYKFASKCVVVTTILSLLTIPIWCLFV